MVEDKIDEDAVQEYRLNILLMREGDQYVAHCLNYPIYAWSSSHGALKRKFKDMVAAYMHDCIQNDEMPFAEPNRVHDTRLQEVYDGLDFEKTKWMTFSISNVKTASGGLRVPFIEALLLFKQAPDRPTHVVPA